MTTLLEKVKSIALQTNKFENRQNRNVKRTFLHIQPMNIPMCGKQSEIVPSKNQFKINHRRFRH